LTLEITIKGHRDPGLAVYTDMIDHLNNLAWNIWPKNRFGLGGTRNPSRRRVRNASAVLKNFVRDPEETFSTLSARLRHADFP
jgi:hypothetical protein